MTGVQNTSKSLINPVGGSSQQELQFGADFVQSLNRIKNEYVEKMANRKYMEIPNAVPPFLALNDMMVNAITKQKNTNLRILFQIARDGLDGAPRE